MPTSNRPAPCPCGRHGWTLPERIRAAHRCKQGETEGASEPNSEPSCEGEVTWAAHRHPVPSLLAERVPLRLARLLWRPGQTGHNVTRGVATARNRRTFKWKTTTAQKARAPRRPRITESLVECFKLPVPHACCRCGCGPSQMQHRPCVKDSWRVLQVLCLGCGSVVSACRNAFMHCCPYYLACKKFFKSFRDSLCSQSLKTGVTSPPSRPRHLS